MRLAAHFDIHGSAECNYHAQLTVGSVRVNLVLDTGSSNTAVVSKGCVDANCTFIQPPHLPIHRAAMRHPVNANYRNARWEGYATGQLVQLQDDRHTAFARVDAITQNDNFLVRQCPQNQGVWGLAYPELQTHPTHMDHDDQHQSPANLPMLDALQKQLNVPNSFSYQLCPKHMVEPKTARALQTLAHYGTTTSCRDRVGHFWLGGYASTAADPSSVTWIPLFPQSHYYELHVDHFAVNGEPVPMEEEINHPRTIIDTGTKDIVLSKQNLESLVGALWRSGFIRFDRSVVSPVHERAFWLNRAQLMLPSRAVNLNMYTNVTVSLGGHPVNIDIENLVNIVPIDHTYQTEKWVNISLTGLSHGVGNSMEAGTILGNTLMRGKTTIWDRENWRIGFASGELESCCNPGSAEDVDIILPNYAEFAKKGDPSTDDRSLHLLQPLLLITITSATLCGAAHVAWFVLQHFFISGKKTNKKSANSIIVYNDFF